MCRLALVVLVPGLFVCVITTQEAESNSKCSGYTLYKDAGGYLMYHEIPVTFDDAKRRCALEGAVLASPINTGIKTAMMDILWNTRNVKSFFTGFYARPNNGGIFISIEGTRLSTVEHTWAPDEPNNEDGLEKCIVLSPRGTMSDVRCDNRHPYFCFAREGRVETWNVCSKGYAKLENTTSCYKYHSDAFGFDKAAETCEQEGGHLLIVNDEAEAQSVKALLVKSDTYFVIVGFLYFKNSGKWITLQGDTIEDAGYAKWGSKVKPSRAGDMTFGLLGKDGLFDYAVTAPSAKFLFICEKDREIVVCE